MGFLYTGDSGTSLGEIIRQLGNKSYKKIYQRCKWKDESGKENDDFFGICSYNSATGKLIPLDGDIYTLNDLYESWEEGIDPEGDLTLTVWERGVLE